MILTFLSGDRIQNSILIFHGDIFLIVKSLTKIGCSELKM